MGPSMPFARLAAVIKSRAATRRPADRLRYRSARIRWLSAHDTAPPTPTRYTSRKKPRARPRGTCACGSSAERELARRDERDSGTDRRADPEKTFRVERSRWPADQRDLAFADTARLPRDE